MKPARKRHLLLEQLEERIFLDANPLAVLTVEPHAEPVVATEPVLAPEPVVAQPEVADKLKDAPVEAGAEVKKQESTGGESNAETAKEQTAKDTTADDNAEPVPAVKAETADEKTSPVETAPTAEAIDGESPAEKVTGASADSPETTLESEEPATADATDSEKVQTAQDEDSDKEAVTPAGDDPAETVTQVVFVDSSVSNHEQLLAGVLEDIDSQKREDRTDSAIGTTPGTTQVVVLDAGSDQVEQISEALAKHKDLQGIHILSHGSDNSLQLGATVIDTNNIGIYSEQLRQWGASLNEKGDILLYGCNIAQDLTEQSFIQSMADLTGADVVASDDPTGNIANGGDWDLEVSTGLVESRVLKDAKESWDGLLAPPVPTTTVNMPAEGLIEENITFTVTFDNTGASGDIGYGPYIDVYVPVGLDVQGVPTYSGASLSFREFTWNSTTQRWVSGSTVIDPAAGSIDRHPFDTATGARQIPLKAGTYQGDAWYVIELPFGSFTPEQPAISVSFTAEIDEDSVAGVEGVADGNTYAPGDAVVGSPLTITARGGFRYGADPLDNPNTSDTIIVQGTEASDSVIPTLMLVTKTSDAPEGQTVTGPNFPVTYTVTIDIAPDQTVTNLELTDYLPNNAYYRDDYVVSGAVVNTGDASYSIPITWQANNAPDNDFVLPLGNVTGNLTDGTQEITLIYSVYYGQTLTPCSGDDSSAINEAVATGSYTHPVSGVQSITAGNTNKNDGTGILDSDNSDHQDQLNSLTVRKSVTNTNPANGLNPGDTLTYTIDFEISDYFGFQDIVVTDTLGDGQHIIGTPTLQLYESFGGVTNNSSYSWSISGDPNLTISRPTSDTILTFNVSGILGGNGELHGDLFDGDPGTNSNTYQGARTNTGTRGTITFQSLVDSDYKDPGTGLDVSVDANDPITNKVTIQGSILDPASSEPLTSGGYSLYSIPGCDPTESDGSSTQLNVAGVNTVKTISHINGIAVGANPTISPGDVVTYRLLMTLPSPDIENFILTDYLPLPVFDADEFADPDTPDPETGAPDPDFDNPLSIGSPAVGPTPAELAIGGRIYWGAATNLQLASNIVQNSGTFPPTVSINSAANSLSINMGTFNADTAANPYYIEILLTATVQNDPFADGLDLTNQATWQYNNTFGQGTGTDGIVQIELAAPELSITKGVIATNNGAGVFSPTPAESLADLAVNAPGSANSLTFSNGGGDADAFVSAAEFLTNPMDSNLARIDGADLVTFAVSVANSGASGAYGLQVYDTLPGTGFLTPASIAAMNLQIWSGTGTKLASGTNYTATLNGDGTLDIIFDTANGALDGDRLGAIPDGTVGDDLFIITYDLRVDNETAADTDMVQAGSQHTNTASITYFTGKQSEVGTANSNWVDPADPPKDDAIVTIATPTVIKELLGTEIGAGDTDGNDQAGVNEEREAVIGERVTYQVRITVPEGQTTNAVLRDTLDRGLELVSIDSVTASQNGVLSSSLWGNLTTTNSFTPLTDDTSTNISYSFVNNGASSFSFNLGSILNSANDNGTAEEIIVTYTAMVVNDSTNVHNTSRDNSAVLQYDVPVDGGSAQTTTTTADSADAVTIIEPSLQVVKTVNVDGVNSTGNFDDQTDPDSARGDAGDAVVYTIVISHRLQQGTDAGATAYDVQLTDVFPSALDRTTAPILTSAIHSGGDNLTGTFSITGDITNGYNLTTTGPLTLDYGETVTLTISSKLGAVIVAGSIITNKADLEWTSYSGKPVDSGFVSSSTIDTERTGNPSDPGGSANTYNDWDPTEINILVPSDKYVVNSEITNESDAINNGVIDPDARLAAPNGSDLVNRGREAVIGELVTYKVEVVLPEAEFINTHFIDTLDPGLTLVSIDSISLVDPASRVTIVGSNLVGGGPYTDASSDYIDYTHNSTGDKLDLHFGTISNVPNNNATQERIEIVYTVMVTDIAANTGNGAAAGTALNNSFQASWTDGIGGTFYGQSDSAETIEVLEPTLTIDKTRSFDGPGDAGDEVTYTITVKHAATSEADAFDLNLEDLFVADIDPATLTLVSANIIASGGAATPVTGAFNLNTTTGALTTTGNVDLSLSPTNRDSLVLVVRGNLASSVNPGDTIGNLATVKWTSINGSRTNYSDFIASVEDQERTYSAFDDAPLITVPGPSITKVLVGTDVNTASNANNEATIGEVITYRVTVNLTEGLTNTAQIVDSLGPGLEYVAGSVSVTTSAGSNVITNLSGGFSSVSGATSGSAGTGQTVTFNLGNLTIDGDNLGATPVDGNDQGKDQVIIEYRAVVIDIPANNAINSADEIFRNSALFRYTNDSPGIQSTGLVQADSVTLVEPDLEVIKTVNGLADGVALTGVDAGDVVTYTFTVRHTGESGSDAYDLVLNDPLPVEFNATSISAFIGAADISSSFSIAGNALSTTGTVNLAVGSILTINVAGTLSTAETNPSESIANTATIDWTSLPSGHVNNNSANERGSGADDPSIYRDSDSALITISAPQIDKQGGGSYTIGDTVTYDINVTLPEGTTRDLTVTDVLPAGLIYTGYSLVVPADFGTVPTPTVSPVTSNDGDDVTFSFSDITTTGDSGTVSNTFIIRMTARVTNVPANHGDRDGGGTDLGTSLTNIASLTYDNPAGGQDLAVTDVAGNPVDPVINVVEPVISTVKEINGSTSILADVEPGDILTYTVTFTNTGDSEAFEVDAEDVLPAGVHFTGSFSVASSGIDTSTTDVEIISGDVISGEVLGISGDWDIPVGDWVAVTYTVQVLAAGFTSGTYTNTVDADWSSQNGDQTNERIYDDAGGQTNWEDNYSGDRAQAQFTVNPTGSIGNTVFFDADADGQPQEAGEVGISGVRVILTADVNNDGTPEFTQTVLTDGSGQYTFANLAAFDNYVITVDNDGGTGTGGNAFNLVSAGYVQTYDLDGTGPGSTNVTRNVNLGVGQNRDDVDFGYSGQNSVGDRVWYDIDGDGVQDTGEGGLIGLTVTIEADIDGDGTFEYTATDTTDANGIYGFNHLPAGSFRVTVTPPAGSVQTYEIADSTPLNNQSTFSLGADQDRDDIDFGYRGTGSIGDTVWFDYNADSVQDANPTEPGISGVSLTLTGDLDGDGIIDLTTTTTTDADGFYHFNNLLGTSAGGSYTVGVSPASLPGGMVQTYDLDGLGSANTTNAITLTTTTGLVRDDIDFGYRGTGSIGDLIFFDDNRNHQWDSGEVGIGGVQVRIIGDIDGDNVYEFETTVNTDNSGGYIFDRLPGGSYIVNVVPASLPTGYSPSADPDSGTPDGISGVIPLAGGEENRLIDFGYASVASIGDRIWYDFNADGVQNGGEVGIGGVTVILTGNLDNDPDLETISLATDSNGNYLFTNLPPGRFTIAVDPATLPAGMGQTYDLDGISTVNTATITLPISTDITTVDFGYTGTGSVGDTVWNDENRNGIQNPGEPGIGGVSVSIGIDLSGDGTPDFTTNTTTDTNGQYLFDHLPAGSHIIRIDPTTLPPGIRPTFDPDGTLDGTFIIRLGAGENNRDVDFGYAYPPPPEKPGTGQITPPGPSLPPPPPGLVIDAFFMHRQFGEEPQFPFDRWLELEYLMPPLPVSPIYTGLAEPGTTLVLALYDTDGNQVGSQTIMADTAGNWLASFPSTLLNELPHDMTIEQRISLYNDSTVGLFNMRTYFNPSFTSLVTSSTNLDVATVFAYLPSSLMESVHMSNHNSFDIRWNNFNGYEFFAPSINPARIGH
jgi:large repetitive protein